MNRVVRWTEDGWEVEPDQRHADLIVQEMGMLEAKPVSTPGEPETNRNGQPSQPLDDKNASKFRSIAARANYLAADRTDLMYAVKEICRGMAKPGDREWGKLKRLARYLSGNGRLITKYAWQGSEEKIMAYSDSDWAVCRQTGKSTSG